MSRKVLIAVASFFAITLALSVVAYLQWQQRAAVETMRPHAKLASLYAVRLLELQAKPAAITFGEYFKKADSAVDDVEKSMMALRAANISDVATRDALTDYMGEVQTLLRELNHLNRLEMESGSLKRQAERWESEARDSNSYIRDSALKQQLAAVSERLDKLKEMRTACESILKMVKALEARQPWIVSTFGADSVVPPQLLADAKVTFDWDPPAKK